MSLDYLVNERDSSNVYSASNSCCSSYGGGVSSTGFPGYGIGFSSSTGYNSSASSTNYGGRISSGLRYADSLPPSPKVMYKLETFPSKATQYASQASASAYNKELAKTYDFFFNKGYAGGSLGGSYTSSVLKK